MTYATTADITARYPGVLADSAPAVHCRRGERAVRDYRGRVLSAPA